MSSIPALIGHPDGCGCSHCQTLRGRAIMKRARANLRHDQALDAHAAASEHEREFSPVGRAETRLRLATAEAEQFARIGKRLDDEIAGQHRGADKRAQITGNLDAEDRSAFLASTQRADELTQRRERVREQQREAEQRARIAVRDIDPYSESSPNSHILDCLAFLDSQSPLVQHVPEGVEERLSRHARIVADAVYHRTPYGRAIEDAHVADLRQQDVDKNREAVAKARREFRALTTGGGATASASGGGVAAFVTPAFVLDQYALYRSPRRIVADQLNSSVELPAYGLEVYVPQITAAAAVGTTTEGGALTEATDPTTAFLTGTVAQKSGQVQLSQAALDRSGPGVGFDVVVAQALKDSLGAQIDLVAITALLANAQSVTDNGSFAVTTTSGLGGMAKDVVIAKAKTTDTAGVRIQSTHLFATSDVIDTVIGYADGQGRPLFQPTFDNDPLPIRAAGDPNGEGYSGVLFWALAGFKDDNIPTTGGTANLNQVIVTRPSTTLLLEGPPVVRIMPQFQANQLQPTATIHSYVCCVPRWPTGASVISGSAYAASNFS